MIRSEQESYFLRVGSHRRGDRLERTARRAVPTAQIESGFTLIEVLLAALIMGFGLSVLLVGTSRCLHSMKSAHQFQTAQWIMGLGEAENPILATNDVEDINVSPVTFDNGYEFEREVEDDEDEDGLFVVKSRVTWPDRNAKGFEEAIRYIYRPKEETTTAR